MNEVGEPFNISADQLMHHAEALADKVFIVGEINEELAENVCRQLLIINQKNKLIEEYYPIDVFINSQGGDLYSAWMICDTMDLIETPINTYGLGMVVSAGLLIFMNGDYKSRFGTKNTQFMSHRFSMVNEGSHTDLISQSHEIHRIHDRIVNHYTKCTGLSKKEIENSLLTEHNVWFS